MNTSVRPLTAIEHGMMRLHSLAQQANVTLNQELTLEWERFLAERQNN